MAAGSVMTQFQLEMEIASRAVQLAKLKFELNQLKGFTDGLGSAGVVTMPVGQRTTGSSMSTNDANVLLSALSDMVTAANGWSTTFAAQIWGDGI